MRRGALTMALCARAGIAFAAVEGSMGDIVFDQYSPLSSNTEIARRLLNPLRGPRGVVRRGARAEMKSSWGL
jgi:hypothetical protein